MKMTPLDRIIKRATKATAVPQELILPKKKKERAKPPKYPVGEEAFDKQIDELLAGKKKGGKP